MEKWDCVVAQVKNLEKNANLGNLLTWAGFGPVYSRGVKITHDNRAVYDSADISEMLDQLMKTRIYKKMVNST